MRANFIKPRPVVAPTLWPNATTNEYSFGRHPGAVTILPLLEDGRVCFVQNYRVAVDRTLIELPAGTLEPGEEIRPLLTTWEEALKMARDGRIQDAKTLVGLLWSEAFRHR